MGTETRHASTLGDATVEEFRTALQGELIDPTHPEYDAARQVWNGAIDRRPALIARCTGVADVVTCVQFARSEQLLVAVRGGGHNVAGNAVCDGGLVVDLSAMKGVWVDAKAGTVRAQSGCTWGELDRETAVYGLATTGGLVSTTGIAGFTLGGGIGWLMRKYGLASDNLVSAEMVNANGQVVTADKDTDPDLFWGIRGGGGNFGIVTSFEFRVHPVTMVLGGMILYPAERAPELLRFYRDLTADLPDELTTMLAFVTAPSAPFIPAELHGIPLVGIVACYTGALDEGEAAIRAVKAFDPPTIDLLGPLPYTALQGMLDATTPPGLQNYWKSNFLNRLDDETINTIVEHTSRMGTPLCQTHVHHIGGAVSRPQESTAFGHRDSPYLLNILGITADASDLPRQTQWVRDFSAAMQHLSAGTYVNFLANEGPDGVRNAYDAASYERLVDLKTRCDPTNLFSLNQNIKPRTGR